MPLPPNTLSKLSTALLLGITSTFAGCGGVAGSSAGPPVVDAAPEARGGSSDAAAPNTSRLFRTIDDMEGDNPNVPSVPPGSSSFFWPAGPGTLGNWFVTGGGGVLSDARVVAISPPRGTSRHAVHVSNHGSPTAAGLDLWAQLDHPEGRPIDLSAYAGISFWARLGGGNGRLTVALTDERTPGTTGPHDQRPSLERTVGADAWERFILLFDDFRRPVAVAGSAPPNTHGIRDIHFIAGRDGQPFDLWIDDLSLVCAGICP